MTALPKIQSRWQLRGDFRALNPVTAAVESFTLLTSPSVRGLFASDQLVPGLGGAQAQTISPSSNTVFTYGQTDAYGQANAVKMGTITAGFGLSTATLTCDDAGFYGSIPAINGHPFCLGVMAKAGTLAQLTITTSCRGPNNGTVFDLTGGTIVGGCNTSTGAIISDPNAGHFALENMGNGWWWIYSKTMLMDSSVTSGTKFWLTKGGTVVYTQNSTDYIQLGFAWNWFDRSIPEYPYSGTATGIDATQTYGFPYPAHASGGAGSQFIFSTGNEVIVSPLAGSSVPSDFTAFLQFLDRGNGVALVPPGLFRLGDTENVSVTGVPGPGVNCVHAPGACTVTYNDGLNNQRTSTVAFAPVYGDLCTVRVTMTGGVVQVNVSINGAGEVAGNVPSALAYPANWNAANDGTPGMFLVNSLSLAALSGDMAVRKANLWGGAQALAFCLANG